MTEKNIYFTFIIKTIWHSFHFATVKIAHWKVRNKKKKLSMHQCDLSIQSHAYM